MTSQVREGGDADSLETATKGFTATCQMLGNGLMDSLQIELPDDQGISGRMRECLDGVIREELVGLAVACVEVKVATEKAHRFGVAVNRVLVLSDYAIAVLGHDTSLSHVRGCVGEIQARLSNADISGAVKTLTEAGVGVHTASKQLELFRRADETKNDATSLESVLTLFCRELQSALDILKAQLPAEGTDETV